MWIRWINIWNITNFRCHINANTTCQHTIYFLTIIQLREAHRKFFEFGVSELFHSEIKIFVKFTTARQFFLKLCQSLLKKTYRCSTRYNFTKFFNFLVFCVEIKSTSVIRDYSQKWCSLFSVFPADFIQQ